MDLKKYLYTDFRASIIVFLVALPLCLGIALASGAPLFAGLLSGIIGGIVVGMLSGSPLSVSGPAAGLASIVASAIQDLGSYPAFLLCVVLAGLFQIALGFLKAGVLGNFFPSSVIKGMLAGIGVILILKQLPHAVGYDIDFEGDEQFLQADNQNTFSEIIQTLDVITPGAMVVALVSILILLVWGNKKLQAMHFFRIIPAPLAAIIFSVGLCSFFENIDYLRIEQKHFVSVPILQDDWTSLFVFPDFAFLTNPEIYWIALTIAIVASLETLLSVEACDKIDPYRRITPLNRELKAQGVANFIAGLLGGLPLTSVIVRSSTNISNGAHTKASAISHGVILMITVLTFPYALGKIPLASLAAILIVVGFKLSSPQYFKDMYNKGLSQFLPFVVTVIGVTFTDLLQGVFLGLLVAIFFILRTNFKEAIIVVQHEHNFLLKTTKDVSFVNKAFLRNKLQAIPSNAVVTIDGSESNFIDDDIKETIADFMKEGPTKGIQIYLKKIYI